MQRDTKIIIISGLLILILFITANNLWNFWFNRYPEWQIIIGLFFCCFVSMYAAILLFGEKITAERRKKARLQRETQKRNQFLNKWGA
jgi:uncharacterized BrkB/YihY/UPF0761 family membrane protein